MPIVSNKYNDYLFLGIFLYEKIVHIDTLIKKKKYCDPSLKSKQTSFEYILHIA